LLQKLSCRAGYSAISTASQAVSSR
jgi:hypothetical protein